MTVQIANCKYNSDELAARFDHVADLFEAIYVKSNEPAPVVYMHEAYVDDYDPGNVCGTTACHGGWAAVLFLPAQELKENRVDFNEGAHQLALELGFADTYALIDWAEENPDTWGNRAALHMFDAFPIAFIPEEEWPTLYEEDEDGDEMPVDSEDIEDLNDLDCEDWPDITLKTIVQWYRDVAERLRAA